MKDNKYEALILHALESEPLSGSTIADKVGINVGRIYPILASLEVSGKIVSFWKGSQFPRRRLYRLSDNN